VVDSPKTSRNDKAYSPLKQYLMHSYYDRYTSLHDSDFEIFMSQEVNFGLCEVLPENHNSMLRLSVLRRGLVGEGSHRRMSTLIKLQTQPLKSLSELLSYSCEFIFIERLPSGVFADSFELQHLAQRGGKYSSPSFYF
jgi:GPI mannosyltransferase 1 subunit X